MKREELFHQMEEDNALDPYFISYYIMTVGLKQDTFQEGISKALYYARMYMLSDDVYLYRLEEDGNYYCFCHSPFVHFKPGNVHHFIFDNQKRLKGIDESFEFTFEDKEVSRMNFVPFQTDSTRYLLFILNNGIDDPDKNKRFLDLLKRSYSILMQNAENYWELERISKEDPLTRLGNRLSYSNVCSEMGDRPLTYSLMDLFRLKFVNDQYGHEAGDLYIQETAKALKKLFPAYHISRNEEDGLVREPTGNHLFRIGGDEFVLISEKLSEEEVEERIKLVSAYLQRLPFAKQHDVPVGVNYGIVTREPGEEIDELYRKSDLKLASNKTETYKTLKLDRRR